MKPKVAAAILFDFEGISLSTEIAMLCEKVLQHDPPDDNIAPADDGRKGHTPGLGGSPMTNMPVIMTSAHSTPPKDRKQSRKFSMWRWNLAVWVKQTPA
jgi:hypothetical protein